MIHAGRLLARRRRHCAEDTMHVVADRFVVHSQKDDDNAGCAIDRATGETVRLTIADAGDALEQQRWLVRCDEQLRERRFATPALVDYGRWSERARFEAWSIEPPATVLPSTTPLPAITLIERSAYRAMAEWCEHVDERRPRLAALWGPPGSGRGIAVAMIARVARQHGIVPLDTRVPAVYRSGTDGRTLLLIDRGTGYGGVEAWLRTLTRQARPHICLLVRDEEVPNVDGIALERVSADVLVASATLPPDSPKLPARVRRAAEQAQGLPGRFVRALWPVSLTEPARPRAVSAARVAEQPVAYGIDDHSSSPPVGATDGPLEAGALASNVRAWPASGELASLRRRAISAHALIVAGRHAPGIRALRQAIGGLARREAWIDACRNALVLGGALLYRGRPREALRALDEAREYSSHDVEPGTLLDIATLTGEAWIDLLKLDEAERVLAGATAAARAADDRHRMRIASIGLARCLFWRGSYAEAEPRLGGDASGDVMLDTRRLRCRARVAAARGDFVTAMTAIEEARALAQAVGNAGNPGIVAAVACSSAAIKLATGDLEGVDCDVALCVGQARSARQPMRILRARLLQIEADRRRGSDRTGVALAS